MSEREFDVGRAKLLIGEISAHLSEAHGEGAGYAELRAEVDALKALLDGAGAQPDALEERMRSVHGMFDRAAAELRADGVRAGMLMREIGRMLGLD